MLQIESQDSLNMRTEKTLCSRRDAKKQRKQKVISPPRKVTFPGDYKTQKSFASDQSDGISHRVPTFLAKVYELVDDSSNRFIFWN